MATIQFEPIPRNATASEVLRFIASASGIDGKFIGKISFLAKASIVEITDSHARKVITALDGAVFRERRVRARYAVPPEKRIPTAPDHFDQLLRLLEIESAEERRRTKELAKENRQVDDPFGASLTGLMIADAEYGLGGRLVVQLTRKGRVDPLPPNRLQSGSPIMLTQTGVQRPLSLRGVLVERSDRIVTAAFEEPEDDIPDDANWRLDLSADEASRQRQQAALYRAQAAEKDRLSELREVLLGESQPRFATLDDSQPSDKLNAVQNDAVAFALAAKEVAAIHGPPGTGKTTTIVELIRRAVARGERVIACAPSNAAVDNLLEKLMAIGEEPVRLGHPARVAVRLRERVLDMLVERHPDARQAKKLSRDANELFRKADKWTKDKPEPGEKTAWRAEARELLAEARKREEQAADKILDEAKIVCATLTGIDSDVFGQRKYDLAVIDEACQSTEPACWIPLLRANKIVLAGDPCQLPPTVLSREAVDGGLGISLMERIIGLHGAQAAKRLTVQYRMHADIMQFPSEEFYEGTLIADESVIRHRLTDLPGVQDSPSTATIVQFIDTAGAGYDEEHEEDTSSRRNPMEAKLVVHKVRELLDAGVPAEGIAVITPYSGQVRWLRELLTGTGVEIDSVDGFQGREKEVVILSFVRSNPEGELGFLKDIRRTNVAMTRAKRKLLMIGDSATLANEPFYQRLLTFCETHGAYSTVWEETI